MEINLILNAGISAVLSAMLALTGYSGKTASNSGGTSEAASAETTESAADTEENNMTSLEVIRAMGNGINLGNTLEAYNHQAYINGSSATSGEIVWGQPRTTQEMIQGMKAAGFDTIRIPIAWTNGMNYESGDYTIDSALMDRVDEVVTWALDADMYVIINDHWDGGWWGMFGSAEQKTRDKAMEMYKAMWTQIGEHFADRSYKLIFESANEELGDKLNDKEITGSSGVLSENECYETTNEINSEFVKLIRSLGGRNADRFLLIAGYNTDITKTCDDRFQMPEDTADSKLLLSVHYYTPWDYCGTDGDNQWGSPQDYDEQNGLFREAQQILQAGLWRCYRRVCGNAQKRRNQAGYRQVLRQPPRQLRSLRILPCSVGLQQLLQAHNKHDLRRDPCGAVQLQSGRKRSRKVNRGNQGGG